MVAPVVTLVPAKSKFKAGDEVWLVTEGPVMAVEKCDDEWTFCIWFGEGGNDTLRDKFPTSVLKLYVEPPKEEEKQETAPRQRNRIVFTPSWNRKKPRK